MSRMSKAIEAAKPRKSMRRLKKSMFAGRERAPCKYCGALLFLEQATFDHVVACPERLQVREVAGPGQLRLVGQIERRERSDVVDVPARAAVLPCHAGLEERFEMEFQMAEATPEQADRPARLSAGIENTVQSLAKPEAERYLRF